MVSYNTYFHSQSLRNKSCKLPILQHDILFWLRVCSEHDKHECHNDIDMSFHTYFGRIMMKPGASGIMDGMALKKI